MLTQVGGRGDEEVLDLLDRRGARFDRITTRDQQGLERFGVGSLGTANPGRPAPRGRRCRRPGESDLSWRRCGPVRPVDLNNMNSVVQQHFCKPAP